VLDRVYRAVAWQRVDQIRYIIIIIIQITEIVLFCALYFFFILIQSGIGLWAVKLARI
jgi:hypothetical protein